VYNVKVEGVLNGILSMLALVEGDKKEGLILSFCEKLSQATNNQVGLVCLKVPYIEKLLCTLYIPFLVFQHCLICRLSDSTESEDAGI
jgi:hypothetical protein